MLRRALLASSVVATLAACGPPPSPPPPPPVDPIATPGPTSTPVVRPPEVTKPRPKAGTRERIAARRDDSDSWDKMLVAGGRLWMLTEVNRWTSGPMYVPAARLLSMPASGGELEKHMDLEGLAAIAADDASLWVAVTRDLGAMNTPRAKSPTGRIFRMPLRGGAPADVVTGIEPKQIAVDRERVWFDGFVVPKQGGTPAPSGVKAPLAIAVDDESVFFTNKGGKILRVAKTGGAQTVLGQGLPDEPSAIALDDTHVYVSAVTWTSSATQEQGVVARVPKAGGSVEVLAKGIATARGLWVSGDDVFVVTGRSGRPGAVLRIPKTGGEPVRIAEDGTLAHVTVDEEGILYTSDGTFQKEPFARLTPPVVFRVWR